MKGVAVAERESVHELDQSSHLLPWNAAFEYEDDASEGSTILCAGPASVCLVGLRGQ